MSRDPFASYDAWLEKPYQEREGSRCPECDSVVEEDGDKFDWTVTCPECGLIAEGGIDPQDYLEQRALAHEPEGDVW